MERWKTIPSLPDYQASNLGRIRRVKPWTRLVSQTADSDGRPRFGINVKINGTWKSKKIKVCRAVLMAFRGMPPKGCEASHLDGNNTNNHLSNLVWESRSKNQARKIGHGTFHYPSRKLDIAEVEVIRGITSFSHASLGELFGVSQPTISRIKRGELWVAFRRN